jgi:predicted enzyme related to lactoylglutathione lyase
MSGDFVWYELMTTDPKAAIAFYSEVIGWKTEVFGDGSGMDYKMWVASQGPLGGVMKLPEEAAQMGAPPHWMSNVTVDDVDATVKRVKELGGKVYREPADMPTVGRFAVIADPQGAAIAIFKPDSPMTPHDDSKHGEFCWSELATTDHQAALAFYSEIFGWKQVDAMDMGPMGTYVVFGKGDRQLGGMFNKPKEMPAVAWLYYTQVDDLDSAIGRAKTNGATLINGPMDVPGGRIAQFTDPQGVFFALHTRARG